MTEALRRGDELHNRNAAATSMLAERFAPAPDSTRCDRLLRAGGDEVFRERCG